jgi:hypothetical protein
MDRGLRRLGTPRPYRVRWFDPQWYEYGGASFAYRDRAERRGHEMADEGCFDVSVWAVDSLGYVVGEITVLSDRAGRRLVETPATGATTSRGHDHD